MRPLFISYSQMTASDRMPTRSRRKGHLGLRNKLQVCSSLALMPLRSLHSADAHLFSTQIVFYKIAHCKGIACQFSCDSGSFSLTLPPGSKPTSRSGFDISLHEIAFLPPLWIPPIENAYLLKWPVLSSHSPRRKVRNWDEYSQKLCLRRHSVVRLAFASPLNPVCNFHVPPKI